MTSKALEILFLSGWKCFLNGPTPASFCLFSVFSTNKTIFAKNKCENLSSPPSIRRRDSNPRRLEHDSSQCMEIFVSNRKLKSLNCLVGKYINENEDKMRRSSVKGYLPIGNVNLNYLKQGAILYTRTKNAFE